MTAASRVVAAFILVGAAGLGSAALQSAVRAQERFDCTVNLRAIGLACEKFAADHGYYPPPAGAVPDPPADGKRLRIDPAEPYRIAHHLAAYLPDPGTYICPATASEPAAASDQVTADTFSYAWTRIWPLTPDSPKGVPLAADTEVRNHGVAPARNVLFVDGTVRSFADRDPQGLDQMAGIKPRPSAPAPQPATPGPSDPNLLKDPIWIILTIGVAVAYVILRVLRYFGARD